MSSSPLNMIPVKSDRFTVIAIAIIAYAGANITHEIIGHCGSVALLGGKCNFISTTDLKLATEIPTWKFRIVAIAGSGANCLAGLMWLWLLRTWRNSTPALRYFLWLSVCVNLFLPSTYLLTSPLIMFGDWYNIIIDLPREFGWRIAMTAGGTVACWFSFRLCRTELGKLIGFGGKSAQSHAWGLVVPAYVIGGATAISAALFSPLPAKWAQFIAAGGTFGVTFWLLLLPLRIPGPPIFPEHHFVVSRSIAWLVAGALAALIFIGALGPGIAL